MKTITKLNVSPAMAGFISNVGYKAKTEHKTTYYFLANGSWHKISFSTKMESSSI